MLVLSKARRNWRGPTPYHYISIEVERAHGFTFRVDSAVRVEKFKAQVGRRGMQMSTRGTSVATTISTVFLSLPVNTEFEADAFTFVPPPPICFPRLLLFSFPLLTPNNVSLLPFNFSPPSSFPILRVYTSSIPLLTSFYFILTTIKLRNKDRGEERSVEKDKRVSTSFHEFFALRLLLIHKSKQREEFIRFRSLILALSPLFLWQALFLSALANFFLFPSPLELLPRPFSRRISSGSSFPAGKWPTREKERRREEES